MNALVFDRFGDANVLEYRELAEPVIGPGEVLVRMKAIGLNFADIYRRKGNYHLVGNPPYILGYEGSGIVEEVGSGVTSIQKGDRIAFADVPHANAELVPVPVEKAIPMPDEISFETAASLMLQGLTAQYLTSDSYEIQKGDTVLVHAAAGGVGQLLVQIAGLLGARVIGLTSSSEKADVARYAGAESVFLYNENWVEQVLQATNGLGVNAVFESVGSTIHHSFNATKIGGTVVFYGMAGGDPEPIDPRMLMDTSKTLTGGDLWNVLTSLEQRVKRSNQLFEWVAKGLIKINEPTVFSLKNGAKAHTYLESRKSTGKILLMP